MSTMSKPIIVVGRHAGEIPGYAITEQRNITWSLDLNECRRELSALYFEANKVGADIVFQNTPGILAVALAGWMVAEAEDGIATGQTRFGVILSQQPDLRPAGVVKEFDLRAPANYVDGGDAEVAEKQVREAVAFVNPRAKVSTEIDPLKGATLRITVDPFIPFEFMGIEWF
jgi:hypothetical protein